MLKPLLMEENKEFILVPWDFSERAENSLLHAIQLAKVVDNGILLVHFIDGGGLFANKPKKEDIEDLTTRLHAKAEDIKDVYQLKPEIIIKEGSIGKSIKNLVNDSDINLMIMGETYESTKTKVTAKEIVKIVEDANVPIILTSGPPNHTHYSEIVVPVDHDKKFKEEINWVIYFSKYYHCNVNVIKPHFNDEYKKKDLSNNIFFTKKMLDKKNIVYGIKTAKKDKVFRDEIYSFAGIIDADLILIMSKKYGEIVAKSDPATRPKIPIMVINPRSDLRKFGGFY